MKILGVHDGHTATAAISIDGEIKTAISEERINRIKEWQGFPAKVIKKSLEITNISPAEIDLVVIASKIQQATREQFIGEKFSLNVYGMGIAKAILPKSTIASNLWVPYAVSLSSAFRKKKEIYNFFHELGIPRNKIIFADHHLCHAYSTLSNEWGISDDALILTVDGAGDGYYASVNVLEKGRIKVLERTSLYNSLGFLYSFATKFLNMKPLSHEYKVMGLAAYAKEEHYNEIYKKLLEEYISIDKSNPLRFKNLSGKLTKDYMAKLKKDFSGTRFDNFAGGLQKLTEELLIKYVKNAMKAADKKIVFCAGGVFMNVKANMRIMYETDVKKLFIFPSCADESNSIGACNFGYGLLCLRKNEVPKFKKLRNIYLGEEYSNEKIKHELGNSKEKLKYTFQKDIDSYVARRLAKGDIIARFSGRMEFGARALGNRSILANPSNKDAVREINEAIKMRDFWMPFAGTILAEDQHKYLQNPKKFSAPYMILCFKTTPLAKTEILSALHQYDLTCRPQILEKAHNPSYHALIKKFKSITGIGALLNTSFNIHGDPLVDSPRDAIETLLKSGLKYLALGNYFVEKK